MKKMPYLIILLFIIAVGIYLNRSYARIYSKFNLTTNPNTSLTYMVGDPKLHQTTRYAALGDSLTAGVGAGKIENSYPVLVAEKLSTKTNNVKLYNLGQPGATTYDVVNEQLPVLPTFQPDVVTLSVGTNDVHLRVPLQEFQKNYLEIVKNLSQFKNTKIILSTIPYLGADSLVLPPYNWYFDTQIKKYNQIIRQIAEEHSLPIADLYLYSRPPREPNQKQFYSLDLFHPSAFGYKMWSDIFYANIR